MDKMTIYTDLVRALEGGAGASVVTVCDTAGIGKKLYRNDVAEEADALSQILADPMMKTDGPVSYAEVADGLTMVERYLPKSRMIIFGGGHISLALSRMAKLADFNTVVYDDRPLFANPERFPEASLVICDDFSRVFEHIRVRSGDYAVIVTRGHRHDAECLEGVLRGTEPAYTGMIGSRRRVAIVLRELAKRGYARDLIDRVYTPIGLRIGAITPAEIAVAILAEAIAVKRRGVGLAAAAGENAKGAFVTHESSDTETAYALAEREDEIDAIITILETKGPVPRETGAKMGMTYDGRITGTIGGGCAESDIMQQARTVIREGGFAVTTVDMTDTAEEDGMVCGGTMRVLIESVKKR
jgi:xanthine dehydrogenase accessory factor